VAGAPKRPAEVGLILTRVANWYFARIYGHSEGPGTLPAYCDSDRVGSFAVSPSLLGASEGSSLFKLFVSMSMFQALRDVVILRQQKTMPLASVRVLTDLAFLWQAVDSHPCPVFASAKDFDSQCDVLKVGKKVDCRRLPGETCPVKEATFAFNRMGDMGKLPTSALLHCWSDGCKLTILEAIIDNNTSPSRRAEDLVVSIAKVYRVGEKLATMFVGALSTPALYPGLAPWYPQVDGNELVVIDTNVAQAVDLLRPHGEARTYQARATWLRAWAREIDLRDYRAGLPRYSPRLLQQALYSFCSKSNRIAAGDPCAAEPGACHACAPYLCPFAQR